MAKYRVACLEAFTPEVIAEIRSQLPEDFEMVAAKTYDEQERIDLVGSADFVLFAGSAQLTGELMDAASQLKLIQKWGIGVDRIDLKAAADRGIPVAITAGANAITVAEHAIMLMLAVYRRLSYADRTVRQGLWLRSEIRNFCYQMNGKTVGIAGLGNIGKEVAKRARAFNTRVLYYDPVCPSPEVEQQLGVEYQGLHDLFAQSDIITLHLPLTPSTRMLVNERLIALMKPTSILVNCSRGEVIDETALVNALRSGRILGAGLDVFAVEPSGPDNPLYALDNVVLTPHSAGSVIDNVANVARHAFANMERVANGEALSQADLVRL
jgi:D-3-phosphoglycerate dehydrogenase